MKTIPFLAVASLGLVALAPFASAQRRASIPSLHQALDQNADGELSATELEDASVSLLTLDRDKDGQISGSEMRPQGRLRGGDRRTQQRRGGGGGGARDVGKTPLTLGDPGVAWYGQLDLALAEAKRSQRPILFMAAASQCSGVPGVF